MRNSRGNTKFREGGGEVLQALEQILSVACGRAHAGADIYTATYGGSHVRADGYFLKELWLMASPHWGRGKV